VSERARVSARSLFFVQRRVFDADVFLPCRALGFPQNCRMTNSPRSPASLPRRHFLKTLAVASTGAGLLPVGDLDCFASEFAPPLVVFTKAYQTLKLNFADSAAITDEAGLNGVDVPVRPGGEIEPERVTQDLPQYAEVLKAPKLSIPLLTTAIISPSSPHAEEILRTAKKVGVQFYRVGFIERETGAAGEKQMRETKAQLKDLAALNRQIGIGGLVQNHSPSAHKYLGGDLSELHELVSGLNPSEMGIAFDIGHALIVHGEQWRSHFEQLKPFLKVAYVKDAKKEGRWVPFGQGDVAGTGYFKLLKELNYHAPISLHIEFDWTNQGKTKTKEALVKALKESATVLRGWLAES
jgi:sugar phosphate isomerase/epimerase